MKSHQDSGTVPVGSPEACASLRTEADEVVSLAPPESFRSVGEYYEVFDQTSDDEVRSLLAEVEEQTPKSETSAAPE